VDSHLKNRKPFALAGLWDYWPDPAGDKELYYFSIITTEPNAFCSRFITVCQSFTTEHEGTVA